MIAARSDGPTGKRCLTCEHAVSQPWGARPDEYLVCDVCAGSRARVPEAAEEDFPDLSENFWRIAEADKR